MALGFDAKKLAGMDKATLDTLISAGVVILNDVELAEGQETADVIVAEAQHLNDIDRREQAIGRMEERFDHFVGTIRAGFASAFGFRDEQTGEWSDDGSALKDHLNFTVSISWNPSENSLHIAKPRLGANGIKVVTSGNAGKRADEICFSGDELKAIAESANIVDDINWTYSANGDERKASPVQLELQMIRVTIAGKKNSKGMKAVTGEKQAIHNLFCELYSGHENFPPGI